ncbi:hypothetical protein [Mycobacterium nebraskense]|uniref:hypothetical protein n=1 Tax=Mycobacterium nebraskense TaxID=244292 RepID=UPI000B02C20A|nr:hypothetical protein [Mycobacterium nebraskense]MBI2695618.1 hypothetical protein [Mycobacterium nebraskense]MCV7116814.1 hypothetical protein [Mycobacterium nebraskense]
MNTDRINRGILLAMVVIGAIAYALLYDHASASFKVLVPVGLAVLVGLIVRDAVNARKR